MSVTRIRTRWLVAWDGHRHVTVPAGELVFADDRISYAGPSYEGPVDHEIDAADALVAPGFVNVHVHAGPLVSGRAFDDYAGTDAKMLGFLQYAAPAEHATIHESDGDAISTPCSEGKDDTTAGAHATTVIGAALATVAELLRGGTTTAVEIGGETGIPPEAMTTAAEALGIRLILGRGFRSRDYVMRDDDSVGYRDRPDAGFGALADAIRFAEDVKSRDDPRLGAMLFPLQIDTCSPRLLREAYAAAQDLDIAMQVHGAQTPFEIDVLAREYGRTPIEQLVASSALGPKTILAHGILLDHHSWTGSRSRDDLDTLAGSGAAVAHCPVAMARRGLALESYGAYRMAGVPVAIGTDTYPRDLVAEMRWAMYLSRIVDRNAATPTSAEILASATSTTADLLQRTDLGRLAPGARADFQVVDLDRYRTTPVLDPIGAWLHTGVAENVRSVWMAGEERVRGGVVMGADERELATGKQRAAEAVWRSTDEPASRRRP